MYFLILPGSYHGEPEMPNDTPHGTSGHGNGASNGEQKVPHDTPHGTSGHDNG